ncbi:MAG: hypothetical protein ACLFS4_08425 [Opitutales bacterium]
MFVPLAALASDYRTLTSADGREIEARILSASEDSVRIERASGRRFKVDIGKFSEEDQAFIEKWRTSRDSNEEKSEVSFEAINETIGRDLFIDANLWDDPSDKVARRLEWPLESKTETLSSYRSYPDNNYKFLGARPFSAALYAEKGRSNRLSLVFANKGDFPPREDGGDALEAQIEKDAEAIESALNERLGEHDRQSFGEGSTYRRVSRWDWNDHAFILSEMDDEYLSLLIMTSEDADAKGRADKLRRKTLAARLEKNVAPRENGDVVIKNIPMVDQGPKGYCVPATFERCLRYMNIPADMYLLAMSGQSGAEGAIMEDFIDGVDRDIGRYGRNLKRKNFQMAIRNVSRYIDKGMPILWQHFSTEDFNELANKQTTARKRAASFDDYREKLEDFRDTADDLKKDRMRGHISMIIGYNKTTEEIAISDSWGPAFEIRWVCIEAVEAIGRHVYVIKL